MEDNAKNSGVKEYIKEELFFMNLLGEPTVRAAAAKTGISEATAYRWVNKPEFRRKYREACLDAMKLAIAKLQLAAGPSVDILLEVLLDRKSPANARISAAKTIWEISLKGIEFENVVERIQKLENKMAVNVESREIETTDTETGETDTENGPRRNLRGIT